ncbi:hypothetical protein J8J17_24265, partial [Mycobacterium tuberculosis]|nr:hypothetical protein [Mycobacterium tuberculosis]
MRGTLKSDEKRAVNEAIAAAKVKAAELSDGIGGGRWTKATRLGDYIEQRVTPTITESSKLSDDTKTLYGRSSALLNMQM